MGQAAAQRPDPDKRLVPWEENGPGEVHVARISDEIREAAWVADRIVELHRRGAAWSDCAVLCRTSRLFLSLQQAFTERGVPVARLVPLDPDERRASREQRLIRSGVLRPAANQSVKLTTPEGDPAIGATALEALLAERDRDA